MIDKIDVSCGRYICKWGARGREEGGCGDERDITYNLPKI